MIGRLDEIKRLRRAFESENSEFVAVYGRRRVGKTFLVKEVFNGRFTFHHAGLENASKREILDSFRVALKQQGHPDCPRLKTWIEAFAELESLLERSSDAKKTVFLDELPWYDTAKSGFLTAFESFWNVWASVRSDILLIVCGSATSWIINKVLRNRGGLHNRVTCQIPVAPFTLRECEEFAAYKHLAFDRRQIAECYMALGGVAYYWNLLQEGLSAAQNFDRLFFGAADEMRNEYSRLFASLFKSSARHLAIVEMLGKRKCGMTREEIVEGLSEGSGGEVTETLQELCDCGFVRGYSVLGKVKRGKVYQLIDNYTLFYFEFLRHRRGTDERYWTLSLASPKINAWRGLAFERLCLWHIAQLRAALGISGILTDVYSWRGSRTGSDRPVQIDLLLERGDNMIDLCEMKYCGGEYEINADDARAMAERIEVFRRQTGTRKGVRTVYVTSYGLKRNKYSGLVQSDVTLDDLFAS